MDLPGVLVATFVNGAGVPRSALELLGGARRLVDDASSAFSGSRVWAVAVGEGAESAAGGLVASGADEVFVTGATGCEDTVSAVEAACRESGATLILFPCDTHGRVWAPRVAWRLGAGVVSECVALRETAAGIEFVRPVYGGKALGVEAHTSAVSVALVRDSAFEPAAPDPARSGPVRPLPRAADLRQPELLERIVEPSAGPSLADADVVVSGGRGLGSAEGFDLLQELASALGGVVGASRAAVDEGWVPSARQVGQSGKSVRPQLYVAIGISGASQHMAGVVGAKTIVAINSDEQAPIFEYARLGVVGDYRKVVPALLAGLRATAAPHVP